MTYRDEPFYVLIERRLDEIGRKAGTVEREAGLKPDTIRNVLRAKSASGPQVSTAREICEALGLEFYIGPPRKEVYRGFAEEAVASFSRAGAPETVTNVFKKGYLPMPWHDYARQPVPPPLAVSLAWLQDHGLAPDDLRFVEVKGTLALVDERARPHDAPAVWCWKEDGELQLGYSFRDPGGPFWIADESGQGPGRMIFSKDLHKIIFLGRVVWSGRFEA